MSGPTGYGWRRLSLMDSPISLPPSSAAIWRWESPGVNHVLPNMISALPLGCFAACLQRAGSSSARIGMELGFIAVRDFAVFTELMPQAAWVDATNLVERLRAIKSPREIEILRTAAELSGAGLQALVRGITLDMDAARMTEIWRDAALTEAISPWLATACINLGLYRRWRGWLCSGRSGTNRRSHQDRCWLCYRWLQFRWRPHCCPGPRGPGRTQGLRRAA